MTELFNRTIEKEKRRSLRHRMPKAEALIWSRLRRKQILGHRFRRQFSVGRFVVDFYAPGLRLAVEIDGDSHFKGNAPTRDPLRQKFIECLGIRVLRFTNLEVYRQLDDVCQAVMTAAQEACEATGAAPKSPPYEGGDLGEV